MCKHDGLQNKLITSCSTIKILFHGLSLMCFLLHMMNMIFIKRKILSSPRMDRSISLLEFPDTEPASPLIVQMAKREYGCLKNKMSLP
jgi:hypothetical protein